jgi:hypothetical protein
MSKSSKPSAKKVADKEISKYAKKDDRKDVVVDKKLIAQAMKKSGKRK